MNIRKAERRDLIQLTLLFNGYRKFYNQTQDLEACKVFIQRRLINNDSYIFVATNKSQLVGFVQLYASFSSVAMQKSYILNDLFVLENLRKLGIANKLMQRAEEFSKDNQACKLILETGISNKLAQSLYIKRGWKRDSNCIQYSFNC